MTASTEAAASASYHDRVRAYERAARAPWAFLFPLLRRPALIGRFAVREAAEARRGTLLGAAWGLITPLLMLGVYAFVFGAVFQARWGAPAPGAETGVPTVVILFSGLIVFNLFADAAIRAPVLVLKHRTLAAQPNFPLDILPWASVAAGLMNAAPQILILLAAVVITTGAPPWTAPLALLALAPLILIALGLTFALGALGVFLRDLQQILPPILTGVLFLSPVFYPAELAPGPARPFLAINPIAPSVDGLRDALLFGAVPDLARTAGHAGIGLLCCWIGYFLFAKTRKAFADVL